MTEPILDVRGLTVGFRADRAVTPVVRGVDLRIEPGRCLALVGESGSGKSVTARSIVGLNGPAARTEADRLSVGDRDILRLSDRGLRRVRGKEVGYVLQDALVSLDPLRPVGREIDDALRLHTRLSPAKRRERVLELLASAGVPEPAQRSRQRSGELSGGLRQRALIASAIALQPPLLIADEPTTALDATVQEQILALLEELKERGTAILLISHDLAVVGRVADDISVMNGGEIVEHGPAEQVLFDARDAYTRRLIAAVPADRPRGTRLSEAAPPQREAAATPAAPAEVVLQARDLVKHYRNPDGTARLVLDQVSFDLHRGRTLGLVGESGSGKTTAARVALGITEPESGAVTLFGAPWTAASERDRRRERHRIGAVYQDPLGSFDPRLSVEDILAEALGSRPGPAAADIARLLDEVGLPSTVLRRRPLHLSGGQRQRVAIARALAPRPEIIVCDEPVSALDVSVQAQVLDLLDDLQRELGLSYLFISHDLGVIQHVSDEVAVMSAGRIVETGSAEQIFRSPADPYTRALLEAAPRLVR
ncbi:dipeptide ABC transporter ATP-binding protein [Leifsonia aquatica]|uniref:dipeptide ABC transporter ATP-binding protein n=1 Tax=Leifsonia aquatica TaxID=144185 RepID=UPI00385072C3